MKESFTDEQALVRGMMPTSGIGCMLSGHHALGDLPTAGLIEEPHDCMDFIQSGLFLADDWSRFFPGEVNSLVCAIGFHQAIGRSSSGGNGVTRTLMLRITCISFPVLSCLREANQLAFFVGEIHLSRCYHHRCSK